MTDRMPCEFFLVRYVPDPVKDEFVNIGVLLRDALHLENAVVRFTRDWSRVRCVDADADLGLLEALEAEIDARLRAGVSASGGTKPIVTLLADSLSNSIQMTDARACLAENMATEIELLMALYVEPRKVKQERKRTGRAAIAGAMRTQFERAGVWAPMRKRIAAAAYTLPGDPLKIDCGYRSNGTVKMFHAVSLEADVEAAKVLAYSAPRLREGVPRVEGATLELTAVVEPLRAVSGHSGRDEEGDAAAATEGGPESESVERYRFGVQAMEREQIRVITTNDLARAAATARTELRL